MHLVRLKRREDVCEYWDGLGGLGSGMKTSVKGDYRIKYLLIEEGNR